MDRNEISLYFSEKGLELLTCSWATEARLPYSKAALSAGGIDQNPERDTLRGTRVKTDSSFLLPNDSRIESQSISLS